MNNREMEIFEQVIYQIGLAAAFVLGLLCALHALLHKREPNSAVIWVALCISIPLVGSLLYIMFGVNRIHRHATKLMLRSKLKSGPGTLSSPSEQGPAARFHALDMGGEDKIYYPPASERATGEDPARAKPPDGRADASSGGPGGPDEGKTAEFAMEVPAALLPARIRTMARIGYSVMGMPLLAGNQVEILYNGDQAYPAMLEAIEQAEKCIYLDTYIFDSDQAGMAFVEALAAARARGVEVRVQVDGTGTFLTRPRIDRVLRQKGITVGRFIPPRLLPPQLSINLRNHRKLLLIDGKVGFTGGMNISSVHMLNPIQPKGFRAQIGLSKDDPMQDIHFRVQGPIIEDFQLIFGREWQFTTGEVLELPEVSNSPKGHSLCRTILDGPDDYLERFHSTLLGCISAAKSSVHIMTPYFLPPRQLITALQSAAMRGVDVSVILPDKVDHNFVKWATHNVLWEFVGRGVRIYYQPAPFNHSKLLLIDGYYSHVGSANLDARSLRLNFELTMEIFDLGVAADLERHYAEIRAKSRECTVEEINSRSLPVKIRDAAFWLFSPYM